jgi:hypothetical protein
MKRFLFQARRACSGVQAPADPQHRRDTVAKKLPCDAPFSALEAVLDLIFFSERSASVPKVKNDDFLTLRASKSKVFHTKYNTFLKNNVSAFGSDFVPIWRPF